MFYKDYRFLVDGNIVLKLTDVLNDNNRKYGRKSYFKLCPGFMNTFGDLYYLHIRLRSGAIHFSEFSNFLYKSGFAVVDAGGKELKRPYLSEHFVIKEI